MEKYYYISKKRNDIKNFEFNNSTSGFGKREMDVLNIYIEEIYDTESFFKLSNIKIFRNLFTLDNFAQKAGEYECRRLDLELNRVKENNNHTKNNCLSGKVNEQYVNSLIDTLFRFSCLYDAKNFELLAPRHEMTICGKKCGSNVDREMRVITTRMVFLVEESKHVTTSSYLKGDLQLACNLIVAHQENIEVANKKSINPLETVFGIKIIGTEAFIYFMNYNKKYLDYLANGKNRTEITIYKLMVEKKAIDITYNSELNLFINILYSIGNSICRSFRNARKDGTKKAIIDEFRNYYSKTSPKNDT
jgi:hypothetical protein